jgi:sulfur-oxidizing protein SoxY
MMLEMRSPSTLTRRTALAAAGAFVMIQAREASAQAQHPGAHAELMRKLTGGAVTRPGRVSLRLPDIADNGNSVPLTVSVDSPMTARDHVKALHVIAEDNPNPDVLSVRFTPGHGKAEVSTRIRLARTQSVHAIAEMSDGSFWSARVETIVTIGGCGA